MRHSHDRRCLVVDVWPGDRSAWLLDSAATPNCSTSFSTRRVDTPSRYDVATTDTRACSARRRCCSRQSGSSCPGAAGGWPARPCPRGGPTRGAGRPGFGSGSSCSDQLELLDVPIKLADIECLRVPERQDDDVHIKEPFIVIALVTAGSARAIPLSTCTLTRLADLIRQRRHQSRSRWPRLDPGGRTHPLLTGGGAPLGTVVHQARSGGHACGQHGCQRR